MDTEEKVRRIVEGFKRLCKNIGGEVREGRKTFGTLNLQCYLYNADLATFGIKSAVGGTLVEASSTKGFSIDDLLVPPDTEVELKTKSPMSSEMQYGQDMDGKIKTLYIYDIKREGKGVKRISMDVSLSGYRVEFEL